MVHSSIVPSGLQVTGTHKYGGIVQIDLEGRGAQLCDVLAEVVVSSVESQSIKRTRRARRADRRTGGPTPWCRAQPARWA
jgi:hypothetical protein